jgi:KaiC/GvpD/RAD55 family RecA-like ATPase
VTEAADPILAEIQAAKAQKLQEIRELETIERDQLGALGAHSLWLEYDDLFDQALTLGEQYPTGFPTIDRFTDGGLAQATMCTIQGKPGIGKTLVATQIARSLARKCAVACLFADEGLTGARIRIGQQLGLERQRMRRPDDVARVAAVRALKERAIFWRFLQPRSKLSTVEFMAKDFDRLAPEGLPRVWLIDSAQVVKSENEAREGRRIQVSDVVWRVRELADEYKAIALLVSQVNRGSYSKKNKDERVDDLAAGSESSAIEYASELILHVDGNPKEKIEIRCPKNRYTGDTFSAWCTADFPTATYNEIDAVSVDAERTAAIAAKQEANTKAAGERMLDLIKRNPGMTSRHIDDALGKMRRQTRLEARAWLQEAGLIFFEGDKGTALRWYAAK